MPIVGLSLTQGSQKVPVQNLASPIVITIPVNKDRSNDTYSLQHNMRGWNDWPCASFNVTQKDLVLVLNVTGARRLQNDAPASPRQDKCTFFCANADRLELQLTFGENDVAREKKLFNRQNGSFFLLLFQKWNLPSTIMSSERTTFLSV